MSGTPGANPLGQIRTRLQTWLGVVALLSLFPAAKTTLSRYFFLHQDIWLIPAIMLVVALCLRNQKSAKRPLPTIEPKARLAMIAAIAIALVLVGSIGHHIVMLGYDLSRDEQMAVFDAWIFSHGALAWPLSDGWRQSLVMLNPMFMLPSSDTVAWVSAYLPVNAMARAGVGLVADPAITSGLFTAVGFLALWRIGLRQWPDDRLPRVASLALYLGSSQVLITSMTAYAMAGHLALNMLWLLFFLRGRWHHDVVALGIGFAAAGLHQVLFHPMFAGPFVLLLAFRGEWRRFAVYSAGYSAIAAFWFIWPVWMSATITGDASAASSGVSLIERAAMLLGSVQPANLVFTALNIVRFVSWQHLAFLPLVGVGLVCAWRGGAFPRALAATLLLPFVVMAILLAYQGHGWGYRYAHGVIGVACLLGGYGAYELGRHGLAVRQMLVWTTMASLLVMLPLRAWMVHRFVAPYAQVDARISASGADIVIIDATSAPFAVDLVINRPDLGNRPLRLQARVVSSAQIARLCARHHVVFVGAATMRSIAAIFDTKAGGKDDADASERQCPPSTRRAPS